MNIYNLQDFKCSLCTKWFHPVKSRPLLLPCSHSICNNCLLPFQQKSKTSIFCPHHQSYQSIAQIQYNDHILEALVRLLKNNAGQSNRSIDENSKNRSANDVNSKNKDC